MMFAAATAFATVIPFSGSGSSGTISPGNLPWAVTSSTSGCDICRGLTVWNLPGFGSFNATWPSGVGNALAFTITFSGLPGGVSIDQTPDSDPTGFTDFTRFHYGDDSVIWTRTFTGSNTVTFTEPGATTMPPGTPFFANIAFNGGNFSSATFTGSFTTTPEPATFALMFAGVGAVVVLRRRKLLQ